MIFYSPQQGRMTNIYYLDNFINLVDISYAFKGQIHEQAVLCIYTKKKYQGG